MLLLGLVRFGRRGVAAVGVVVVVAAWLDRAAMAARHASAVRLNFSFDAHMDAIALGALLAVAASAGTASRVRRVVGWYAGAAVAAAAILVGALTPGHAEAFDPHRYGSSALLLALLVRELVLAPGGRVGRVLACAPLVHLGKLSYGLYLWNMLLRNMFQSAFGAKPLAAGWTGLIWPVALLAVAEASYRWVEQPLRRRWARRPVPAAAPDQRTTSTVISRVTDGVSNFESAVTRGASSDSAKAT